MSNVIITNGRQRETVRIAANQTFGECLAIYCEKHGLDMRDWGFINDQKKPVDMTLSFRLSGYHNNVKFTMVRSVRKNQSARIALQMQGCRYIDSFETSVSLWEILIHFEMEKGVRLVSDVDVHPELGVEVYMQPVITFTNREIATNSELREISLDTLGITHGSAVLRYQARYTTSSIEEFLEIDNQNMIEEEELALTKEKRKEKIQTQNKIDREQRKEIQEKLKEDKKRRLDQIWNDDQILDLDVSKVTIPSNVNNFNAEREVQKKKIQDGKDLEDAKRRLEEARRKRQLRKEGKEHIVETKPKESKIEKIEIVEPQDQSETNTVDRNTKVFLQMEPFDRNSYMELVTLPESYYDLTKKDLSNAQSKPSEEYLTTKAFKEREREKLYSKYTHLIIRFKFPDQTSIQANFHLKEKVNDLYTFMSQSLLENIDFELYTTPPRIVLDRNDSKYLRDHGFVPAVLVYVSFPNNETEYISQQLLETIEEAPSPLLITHTNTDPSSDEDQQDIEIYYPPPTTEEPTTKKSNNPSWIRL